MVRSPSESDAPSQDGVVIRPLTSGDAPALLRFYNGRNAHSRRWFRGLGGETADPAACERAVAEAANPEAHVDLVAVDAGGAIIGWGFVWKLNAAEPMFGLVVADGAQGRGLGRRLAAQVLAAVDARGVPEVHLTVVEDNARAIALYWSLGFVDTGGCRRPDGLDYRQMVRRQA